MHDWVEKLLILQEMDLRIGRLAARVKSAPAEKKRIDRGRKEAASTVSEARARLQDREKALKTLEIEADTVREKMRDFQSKSAFIKSNEEYRAAMSQIDGCKRQIDGVEDRQLAVMEDIEALRTELEQAQKELDAANARADEQEGDLDVAVKNSEAQLEKLHAERVPALAEIDPKIGRRYERLRRVCSSKPGDKRALVPIRDDVCDRCHMNVIAQLRNNARKGADVTCENCGALLYWEG